MKVPGVFAAAFLLQSSLVVDIGPRARPEHLRYERRVAVASGATGMACAALDVTVLSHTASPAHSDLRLFHSAPGEPEAEVPYTLTESGPEPVADTAATVERVGISGSQIRFDLRMPARPYSEVRLRLGLRNFVATATVEGEDLHGGRHPLGSVAIFDLSSQHLGTWSSLLLGEASWPLLHVVLDVRTPQGGARTDLSPDMIRAAEVPPSRMRQTRYVPTVSTSVIDQRGALSIAMLRVPAHVPVERVAFQFEPGFSSSFAREVTVSARADRAPVTDTEALDAGVIEHVNLPSGDARLYPIALREDALDATLGATLARPATVLVAVDNAHQAPVPIRSVVLEMRERKLCFFADRIGTYVLRYGDPALSPPAYNESALAMSTEPLAATLGAEAENPRFVERHDVRPFVGRHPELYWLLVLLCGGMMGGSALHYVQHRRVR